MKMIAKILTGLVTVALLAPSCKKDISELPAPTQTGANTFGAKVDGSFFVPQGFGPFASSNKLEARYGVGRDLYINARNYASAPNEKEFQLFIKDVRTTGVYPLNSNTPLNGTHASYGYYVKRNVTPQNEWITSAANIGSVNITFIDTINRIVSGTFEFKAGNLDNTSAPLTVTEGRFDVKIQ